MAEATITELEQTLLSIDVGKIVSVSGSTVVAKEVRVFPPDEIIESEVTLPIERFPTDLEIKPGYGYTLTSYLKDHRFNSQSRDPKREFIRDLVSSIQVYTSLEFPK